MKKVEFEVPAMYGDHHVLEVRKALLDIPGVEEVYASSAFQVVEVTYDPKNASEETIRGKLDEMGYLGEWTLPMEAGVASEEGKEPGVFYRHTDVFETAKQVVGFRQEVSYSGRPLWYCPGFGVIKNKMED